MAQMQETLRIIAEIAQDAGAVPDCTVDTQNPPLGPLTLSGFKVSALETVVLAPAAVDQVLMFTDVAMLLLLADQPFSLRLAAGETLVPNLRAFVVQTDQIANGALTTGVLLTGNGSNEAVIQVLRIEKV
jgi:hypothetical protein